MTRRTVYFTLKEVLARFPELKIKKNEYPATIAIYTNHPMEVGFTFVEESLDFNGKPVDKDFGWGKEI